MDDNEHITRRELDLIVKNLALTVSAEVGAMMDGKILDWEARWNYTSNATHKARVLELTGESLDNIERIRAGTQYAIKAAESTSTTMKLIKKTIISYTIPCGLSAAIAWFVAYGR